MSTTAYAIGLLLLALVLALVHRRYTSRKELPLPPGPKGLPIIGNVHQLPKAKQWLTYQQWGKEYGPLVHISAMGQSIVIVNSQKIAIDLLDTRGVICSARPHFPFACGEIGWDRNLLFAQPGERLRDMRKILHRVIGGKNTEQFASHIEKETWKFLVQLLDDPIEFRQLIRVTAGAIILRVSHGYIVDRRPHKDPLVQLVNKAAVEAVEATEPGKWMIDILPILKYLPDWFPGAGFKRTAKEMRKNLEAFTDVPYDIVLDQIRSGDSETSCARALLEEVDNRPSPFREDVIKWATGSMFGGGADTTVSTISTFFLAMALYPRVRMKAQEEIDRVVGKDRIVTFTDRPNLPYMDAMVKETLRWAPVLPTGFPHVATEETEYGGYRIPKGSMIIANAWGISHDENNFSDPETFNPDRFLGSKASEELIEPSAVVFGYGRRICPGRSMANLSLWISMATVLQTFDIIALPDHPPSVNYTDGFLIHPTEFQCSVVPRSKRAEEIVRGLDTEG